MANIKFEIDGKTYDFTSENFWKNFVIDNERNIILKPTPEKRSSFERVAEGEEFYYISGDERPMTPEEFAKKAQKIYDENEGFAGESGHIDIDRLMVECLESLGYGDGCDILFSMTSIWYA